MEKIGVQNIEVRAGKFEEFDVYPCNCKVGDTVWFDDGIPDDDGVVRDHHYLHGKVQSIDPAHWWIYSDGEKVLGCISVKVEDDEFFAGQNFQVNFQDILYEEPDELLMAESLRLLESCKRLEKEMTEMNEDIKFLINEYKTNKRYFRQEPGRCTVEDVIKTVYEFAWAASKNYHN